MKTISFIGAGNMAFAMASALYDQNKNKSIGIYDIDNKRVDLFKENFSTTINFSTIKDLEEKSDIIILAVKPQVIDSVLNDLSDTNKVVVSIAAGITLKYLQNKLPNAPLVRVMPNTPSLVGSMAAGVSFSEEISPEIKSEVMLFLSYSGLAIEVEDNQMDAVTGVSGSGPAFVARIIKHFIDAGVNQGLNEKTARDLATNTFLGTAKLIIEKNMDIENLIQMVSSPGGTTIAGRGVLENSNIADIINETVNTTVKRSIELGLK